MYQNVKEKIIKQMSNEKSNAISFGLPKLEQICPLVVKGMYSCITANPSVGKTTLLNYIIFSTIKYCIENKHKLKVIWFALEDGKEKVVFSLISFILKTYKNKEIGYMELNSFTNNKLSKQDLALLESVEDIIQEYLSYLIIEEDVGNPTGLYNIVKKYAIDNNHVGFVKKQIGNEIVDSFKSVENEELVMVVVDHISLLNTEKDCPTLRDAMIKWSKYCKSYITLKFQFAVVNVQQQQAAAENVEHFKSGRIIPTQDKLADAPVLGRDYRIILGLFYPYKYEQMEERGYNIGILKHTYRSVYLIKNTFGKSNVAFGVFFNGACSFIKELPEPNQMTEIYKTMK